jgi:hypothetical protein
MVNNSFRRRCRLSFVRSFDLSNDSANLAATDFPSIVLPEPSNVPPLKFLVQALGFLYVLQRMDEKGQGQLRRSASSIAPTEIVAMMVDVLPERKWSCRSVAI